MINEDLMGVGSFSIDFDGLPYDSANWGQWDQIYVTPTWMPDPSVDRTTLQRCARYRGVIEDFADDRSKVTGAGMLSYLGDGSDIGDAVQWTGEVPKTWAQWTLKLVTAPGYLNGIGVAAVTGTAPTATWPNSGTSDMPYSARRIIETLATALGIEYRIGPDGVLRSGVPGSGLFQESPRVVLTRSIDGRDITRISPPAASWKVRKSWANRVNYVRVEGDGGVLGSADTLGSETAKDADGVDAIRRKVSVTATGASTSTDCDNFAAGVLAREGGIETFLDTSIDIFDPGFWMAPGDWVYAWDLADRLYSLDYQISFLGQTIQPQLLRLFGMSWPPMRGMGVYFAPSDASEPIVDLTPWVAWEDGPTRLEVGAPRRSVFER
jgi:hypothetical protein